MSPDAFDRCGDGGQGSEHHVDEGAVERGAELAGNVDALWRDVDDLESLAASALAEETLDSALLQRVEATQTGMSYAQLTAYNDERRSAQGWGEADLLGLLDEDQRAVLAGWQEHDRLSWQSDDLAAVAVAGLFGVLATAFDTPTDRVVLQGLGWVKQSDLLRRWEKEAARLSIDYTGPHFGGPAHRVRSAGHDVGRLFAAVSQVRAGVFRGVRWEDHVKILEEVTTTRSGLPFKSASDPSEALALLMKHWAADFVTPMSLPLPGWTLLYEMPDRDLRKFAHRAYAGAAPGEGLNLRSGVLTPQLGMVITELIIRTHVHLATHQATGSAALSPAGRAKRTEMLLAAHGVAGAASLTKSAAVAIAERSLAPRHVNVPVLLRTGHLALAVRRDIRDRDGDTAPTWQALWEQEIAAWELGEAVALADLLGR